jgi:predicted Zn-dependent peptidase
VDLDQAESAVWEQLQRLAVEEVSEFEFRKSMHQLEASLVFARLQGLNVVMNLCYFEYLSKAEDYDLEIERYRAVTPHRLMEMAGGLLQPSRASVLRYVPEEHA